MQLIIVLTIVLFRDIVKKIKGDAQNGDIITKKSMALYYGGFQKYFPKKEYENIAFCDSIY